MSPTSPRIRLLLEWCKINAITIDEKLEVVELPNEGDEDASSSATSIGVIAKEYIPPLTSRTFPLQISLRLSADPS